MKIALLSCTNWEGAFESEEFFAKEINFCKNVEVVAWDDVTVQWTDYEYLIFRTVWDYFDFPAEFSAWLECIEQLGVKTLNPIDVIRRNQHKFYLRTLEAAGIDIIPTIFIEKNTTLDLSILKEKNWEKAVIKPAVSAASFMTKLFSQEEIPEIEAEYAPILVERDLLLQPFMPEIQTQGELSIIFYEGKFSHSILKKPIENDFRVQYQYGGKYEIYHPDNQLLITAEKIVKTFGGDLLYARVDGILSQGKFLLMELELIEPDLYFDHHPDAKGNFLKALERAIL